MQCKTDNAKHLSICKGKKRSENGFNIGKSRKHKNECKVKNNIKTVRIGSHIIVLTIL